MSLFFFVSLIIFTMSLMFIRMFHPLAMGMTLLVQTVLICLVSGLSSKSMWFSYILFLIFLGAMLVLFIYVASLASNESFLLSPLMVALLTLLSLGGVTLFFIDPMLLTTKNTVMNSFISFAQNFKSTECLLSSIYNPLTINLTLYIILYLLLTLVVAVKITSAFFGPLRLS